MSKSPRKAAEEDLLLASEVVTYGGSSEAALEERLQSSEQSEQALEASSSSQNNGEHNESILSIPGLFGIESALFLGIFLGSFDGTVTSSSYPTIANEFKAVDLGSMITVSYLITVCSFQSLYGSFSDVFGRRYCLFFANVVFLVGLCGCSVAKSMNSLFLWRAITGIGGAGLITLTTIVNSDIVPRSKRGLFQGIQNVFMSLGNIAGASLGGFICDRFGWRYCFIVQVPVTILATILAYLFVKDQDMSSYTGRKLERVDISGSFLLVIGLAVQLSSLYASTLFRFAIGFGVSALVLSAFLYNEYLDYVSRDIHHKISIIPFETLKGGSIKLLLTAAGLAGFVNFSYLFILPLLFQVEVGDSATKAGFRLAIPATFTAVGSFINGYAMNRNVDNLVILLPLGLAIVLIGNSLALLIGHQTPSWLIDLLLTPTNLGLGLCYPALLFSFVFQFPQNMHATSTTTLFLFRSIGQVWGVAASSSVISNVLKIHATKALKNLGGLSLEEVKTIVQNSLKSLSYVNESLHGEVKVAVKESYSYAIRAAQLFTVVVCAVALAVCFIRLIMKRTNPAIRF
ncbi:unnamed protein product [Kuraishia capsulata CBS 1993]|uniref:Major facilitator superfamily (MFS) profile domain-containing protein n=1 Tax=Kuraishia capsulata CBS 1993 TaxID=1382522 RepID=W6MS42_9ASCO|nr:uncharacterized protein KUCA_T00000606001 [Kuraishia capsulata CBS 1993]CDK24640.1 unnamed protein product [Kuraishia capsulata CBS 1993]